MKKLKVNSGLIISKCGNYKKIYKKKTIEKCSTNFFNSG